MHANKYEGDAISVSKQLLQIESWLNWAKPCLRTKSRKDDTTSGWM